MTYTCTINVQFAFIIYQQQHKANTLNMLTNKDLPKLSVICKNSGGLTLSTCVHVDYLNNTSVYFEWV